ncbi:aminopeptidase [Flavobacterium psychrotolerans]|uniref:Aminopeptidase n=2 Tax=Flavobacterium psychrotolerans TaxID=2169410 RepID=A0A2U1JH46_9FLAO|nr:aminopeptidase [Flavobacterium psychrotolerans]
MTVAVNAEKKTINVFQELTFFNESTDTLSSIVLNDWNNAYSTRNSLLAKRFSDEFIRNFHLAKDSERGNTGNITIIDENKSFLNWNRTDENPDLIELFLNTKLAPNQKIKLSLTYVVKIPSDKFTKYGYGSNGEMNLKNWYLTPARFENHSFIKYSNANLDDIANAISDIDLEVKIPASFELSSDLNEISKSKNKENTIYTFSGKNRLDFSLFLEPKSSFFSYKNGLVEVITNLKDNRLNEIQKAIIIDRIVTYVSSKIGPYPHEKISVSEVDYDRNPFYGLNQLPAFISPFSDEFLYELKFLKTYLNNYLKNSLNLDARKDNWIFDGIQVYAMMKYIEENHPDSKMMGNLAKLKILKSFNIINLDFNEQYSYYYMLMARKNLDQPLSESKDSLIRFNEKIASKYRAGLSLKYLDNYLDDAIVTNSIKQFYAINTHEQTSRTTFEALLKNNANKNIDWFFETIINSRAIIDYKFNALAKTKDSITFNIKNKTGATVPIPIYGIKKGEIVFKKWLENIRTDSTFTFDRKDAEKIVINYKNEVPEYNLRNNWKSLKGFSTTNRPIKFAFMKDLEDPYYNQVLYVPTFDYNFYDGLSPGLRLHNKTILDKPFTFDINPMYSPNTKTLVGNYSLAVNQNYRDGLLYNVRYSMNGSYFHYAPDAAYFKINPTVTMSMREWNLRDNRRQGFFFRYNIVNKEPSKIINDTGEKYSVFNAKYYNTRTEITNHLNFRNDLQLSSGFGKIAGEIQYRKLFDNNRQINLRLYTGTFIYNKNLSNAYDFGLDRPKDYLFEYNFFGRSETSGFFSQQFILAEGGFKSKLIPASANQWMVTTNASFNVWNWVEIYGDLGFLKNKNESEKFVYDSGIRLNLVTDYFELYFPVYSNNGWEISHTKYPEKIRFVVTMSPNTLLNLFTRKWF